MVKLRVTGKGGVLPDAVIPVRRDLRAVVGGVGQRVRLRRVAVVARVHGEIEVMAVDDAAAGAGGEHPAGWNVGGPAIDDLDADGGQVGGDTDLLLFAQGQRGGDQVELDAAPLRVGPEAFAGSRVLELVAGVVEQLDGGGLIILRVPGSGVEAPVAGLNAHQCVRRHHG